MIKFWHLPLIMSLVGTVLWADEPAKQFSPLHHHQELLDDANPEFAFRDDTEFDLWQPKLRASLRNVLALPVSVRCPLDVKVTAEPSTGEFDSFRVVYQSEPGVEVPCFLLLPKNRKGPLPVMICLQGHKKKDGMLVSVGRVPDTGGRDIAVQAVRNGWAALAVEQRCFGERLGDCQRESLDALMLGRTLTGERVFDVIRAVDFIETRSELDKTRIGCMGNSTGGTVTFYAACVEPRIRLAVVSCSYCTYAESWMKIRHCACGYLPGILKVADMGDLAGLVAPRNLIIVAGKKDYLATMKGVRTAFAQTKKVFIQCGMANGPAEIASTGSNGLPLVALGSFSRAGLNSAAECADNAELLVGQAGHQFYPDLAWPRIQHVLQSWAEQE